MTQYGVTVSGFRAKMQQEIIADINTALQNTFGANINLGAESVFGQLVGVFSEREALLWALAEAVYASQYPGGAEGTSVDNILALNNLTRLPATPSITDPTPAAKPNGVVLYGLVLYGSPGTVISKGSQIRTTTVPALTYTLDNAVTIGAPVNAQQNVVLSNSPTAGGFQLALVDADGNTLTTGPMPFNTADSSTALTWSTAPSLGRMVMMLGDQVVPPVEPDFSSAGFAARINSLGAYGSVGVSGSFASGLLLQWGSGLFNPTVNTNPTVLTFGAGATGGAYTLALNGTPTASLPYSANAAAVQAAIKAAGYPRALVGPFVPVATNLLSGNVRTGTDLDLGTNGFLGIATTGGYATTGVPSLASSSDFAYQGTRSLLVGTGDGGSTYGVGIRVPVTAGTQYTFSCYARSQALPTLSLTPATAFNVSGGSLGPPVVVNNTGWTRITYTFTVPAGQTAVQVMVGATSPVSTQFYLDGFQLEAAGAATAWADIAGVTGFAINFVGTATPTVTVTANTLTGPGGAVSLTVGPGYTMDQPVTIAQSMQAQIENLLDPNTGKRPFTDVQVSQSGSLYTVSFGGTTLQAGEASSGSQPQPTITVPLNTLQAGGIGVTNVAVAVVSTGAPAQGTGTATCTVNGPNATLAGQLSVIGSATSGWTGVTNQLDALPGTDVETDTQALVRRSALAAAQARGPLQGIVERVLQVPGVTGAIGFSNTTAAALQTLTFATIPTSGSYQLVVGGGTTAPIPYSASSAAVQAAIGAVTGYGPVSVTGGMALGFIIDFNGSSGGQWQPLAQVVNNTTGIAASAAYGRPPKSFEIVVQGGAPQAIASTIYGSMPAGIASYGTPAAQTLATTVQASAVITVASGTGILAGQGVFGQGIPSAAYVAAVSGNSVTLSAAALGSYANTPVLFNNSAQVLDAFNNPVTINFSRPSPILFYVNVSLTTDQYRSPGDPTSGINPQSKFSPGSIAQLQADIARIGNKTPIGGLVVGFGTNGLVGAFNEIAGIVGYALTFGVSPSPVATANVQLLPTQVATFQVFNISVAWS